MKWWNSPGSLRLPNPAPPVETGETITEPIALTEDTQDTQDFQDTQPEPVSDEYVTSQTQDIIQGDVLVVKDDTLWSIASAYKDQGHSMSQVMLAFQRANPDAFTDGNINNMKVGAVLRTPVFDELDAIGQQEAYAEVLVQNGLWDEYVARVTGVSPALVSEDGGVEVVAEEGAEEGASEEAGGELSLLLPGEGESESTGIGDTGDVNALRTRLAIAEEDLDASRIENQELESRIAELQARLSKVEELQKMVEIEDDSLAQMQADQIETATAMEQAEEQAATESVTEAIEANEEALLEELLAEEAAAQAEDQADIDGTAVEEASEDTLVEDTLTDETSTETASTDGMMTEATEPGVTAPPPVIVSQPVTRAPSIFDGILPPDVIDMISSLGGILGDPIILGAIGGFVVLLVILVVLKRRKSSADDESGISASGDDDLFAADDEDELTPIHLPDGAEPDETDIKLPDEDNVVPAEPEAEPEDEFAATAIISAVDMPEPEAPAPAEAKEQDDVLNEVDVYLAYGLYDNAEDLLNSSLTENPDRADFRSKLLDTYFATKNVEAFNKEADKLQSMGDAASDYWDRVQIMGYELAPDNPLFSDARDSGLSAADLEFTRPQEADFDLGVSDDDDTNFSVTDFHLSEDDTGSDFSETSNLGEPDEIAETEQIPQLNEFPDLDGEDDTGAPAEASSDAAEELPDDVGDELEFSIDEETSSSDSVEADNADVELFDDLDIDSAAGDETVATDDAEDSLEMKFDIDEVEAAAVKDEANFIDTSVVAPGSGSNDDVVEDTAVLDLGVEDTAVLDIDGADTAVLEIDSEDTAEFDIGSDEAANATGDLSLGTVELSHLIDDENEDISIIDFGIEDFDEPTAMVGSIDAADDSTDMASDDGDKVRTGTFAPGDFEEPTALVGSIADIDDIDDLMLPDDVDEVSTKLDLARAFIDMGDTEGARGSLEEVMSEGSEEQKAEAAALLEQI